MASQIEVRNHNLEVVKGLVEKLRRDEGFCEKVRLLALVSLNTGVAERKAREYLKVLVDGKVLTETVTDEGTFIKRNLEEFQQELDFGTQ